MIAGLRSLSLDSRISAALVLNPFRSHCTARSLIPPAGFAHYSLLARPRFLSCCLCLPYFALSFSLQAFDLSRLDDLV